MVASQPMIGLRRVVLGTTVVLLAASLAGAAIFMHADPNRRYADGIRVGVGTLSVPCGDRSLELSVRWSFPERPPIGLAWVQHGFARSGERMADLADRLAARGLVAVAPTVDAFGPCSLGGSDPLLRGIGGVLAERDGALLASARDALRRDGLHELPEATVLVGHSAGGAAMTGVAASLVEYGARVDLRALVLLDPVESRRGTMAASLPALEELVVRTVAAPADRCNAEGSGVDALEAARGGFLGVRLPGGCHCDPEGRSTNAACTFACGASDADDVAVLQELTEAWIVAALEGSPATAHEPGGARLESLVIRGSVRVLGVP
jgi:hypothetical protein